MAKTVRYWYIKLAIVVGAAVWGAQPMHAGVATPGQTYYKQMNTHAFQSNAKRLLEPVQAVPATVAVPIGAQTFGAQYSAARLQAGSSVKVQSYGECSGYSYGGGIRMLHIILQAFPTEMFRSIAYLR